MTTDTAHQMTVDRIVAVWRVTAKEAEQVSRFYLPGNAQLLDHALALSRLLVPDEARREFWFAGSGNGRRGIRASFSPLTFLLEDRLNLQALVNVMATRS